MTVLNLVPVPVDASVTLSPKVSASLNLSFDGTAINTFTLLASSTKGIGNDFGHLLGIRAWAYELFQEHVQRTRLLRLGGRMEYERYNSIPIHHGHNFHTIVYVHDHADPYCCPTTLCIILGRLGNC